MVNMYVDGIGEGSRCGAPKRSYIISMFGDYSKCLTDPQPHEPAAHSQLAHNKPDTLALHAAATTTTTTATRTNDDSDKKA